MKDVLIKDECNKSRLRLRLLLLQFCDVEQNPSPDEAGDASDDATGQRQQDLRRDEVVSP